MSETRVVHVNDNVPGAVYIGRANGRKGLKLSPLSNPFKLYSPSVEDRRTVIRLYRERLMRRGDLLSLLPDLRSKPIACWCRRDGESKTDANACHGDVLVDLLNQYTDDELLALIGDADDQ